MQDLCSAFAREGYVTLPNVVSKSRLAALTDELRGEYARARANGELFSGGGLISGHLDCFPGAQSRFVYDELEQYGVFDLVRNLSPSATRMPNIGCNPNLPNRYAQNLSGRLRERAFASLPALGKGYLFVRSVIQ